VKLAGDVFASTYTCMAVPVDDHVICILFTFDRSNHDTLRWYVYPVPAVGVVKMNVIPVFGE
jgi:hypothetical protein